MEYHVCTVLYSTAGNYWWIDILFSSGSIQAPVIAITRYTSFAFPSVACPDLVLENKLYMLYPL